MQDLVLEYIYLIFIIIGLVMLANRLNVAYPIVLVLGGLVVSFIPLFQNVHIDPELIFFLFLPPLLFDAAWQTSWKELWRWRRVISSFAFPIVILTSCVIAFASSALIPGFTLAMGFLLGGIISPPDAISATAIMRRVKAPKIMVSIVEGESLLNDASALIVFRFALAAVITGQFDLSDATVSFFLVITMGTAIGLAIGYLFYAILRWLPTPPSMEIVLSLMAPYCMYYFAEQFHFSGVLAVVAGGLFLSGKRHRVFSYRGRVEGSNVWSTIGFVLNGIVFMLIGLELSYVMEEMEQLGLAEAVGYGLIISAILIVIRIACTLGASAFTVFMSRFIKVANARPGWRMPFVFGWAGMRGVVSLAAALSIPVLLPGGEAFPHRNLILVITFVVILVTLVFQGLTLPWMIRRMKIRDAEEDLREQAQELAIRKSVSASSLKFLEALPRQERLLHDRLDNLAKKLRADLDHFQVDLNDFNTSNRPLLMRYHDIYIQMLEEQRGTLHQLNRLEEYDEELIRKYLALVDLEEVKLRGLAMKD